MLTVRLNDETERRLDALVRRTGKSRSEVVRDAIQAYEPPGSGDCSVYDQLADVIGVASLGGGRGRHGEQILRESFARKRKKR